LATGAVLEGQVSQLSFSSVAELLQGSEAAINEVVFLGIASFFLLTLDER